MKKFRLEFAVIVTSILLMALYFSDTTMTGFASAQVFYGKLNLSVDQGQSFVLKGVQSLRSLTLTGEVVGSGAAMVVLDDGAGGRKVVYSNDGETSQLVSAGDVGYESAVTLVPQYTLAGYQKTEGVKHEGLFESCGEVCALNTWTSQEFILNVYVEPGTKVVLRRITYTS